MSTRKRILEKGLVLVLTCSSVFFPSDSFAEKYKLVREETSKDEISVYYGEAEDGAEVELRYVNLKKIISETLEFKRVKEENVKSGSGRYWIESAGASDRAIGAVEEYAVENGYDIICSKKSLGYLGIESSSEELDVTEEVIEKMKEKYDK